MSTYKERELSDDYPVKQDFLYVSDGEVIRSVLEGTVADLKKHRKSTRITNCDIAGRDLWDHMV
mgnify:CR=1 FL=1